MVGSYTVALTVALLAFTAVEAGVLPRYRNGYTPPVRVTCTWYLSRYGARFGSSIDALQRVLCRRARRKTLAAATTSQLSSYSLTGCRASLTGATRLTR